MCGYKLCLRTTGYSGMPGQNSVATDLAMPGVLPQPDGNGQPPIDGFANRIPALTAALSRRLTGFSNACIWRWSGVSALPISVTPCISALY
ncbi:hypothetical protein XIS1_1820005 [Xenorhabdus innexi]|uniref:Uncharacterized protein n=1 Tax=Xenorhabdus innexi TaxID=290109 RepID=A0A1N6MX17_9GAMM|nr:hypothetical protein XIS1_1820005 [Xenorhabdus innexi]